MIYNDQIESFPEALQPFVVASTLKTLIYIPDFIDRETESELMHNIYSYNHWQYLSHRRLQIWGGKPHRSGMLAENIPEWLHALMDKVSNLGVFGSLRANHVLINEYKPGQGIMPHHDGDLYHPVVTTVNLGGHSVLDFYNPISEEQQSAALSDRYVGSALLMPRSLNIVTDSLYTYYLHGIEERESDNFSLVGQSGDCEKEVIVKRIINHQQVPHEECNQNAKVNCLMRHLRISVTIRHVPNTRKVDLARLIGGSLFKNTR